MALVTLQVFDNPIDAHVLKSKLESEGIQSVLFDENMVSLNPLFNITVGGIKLKISDTDLEQAQELLHTLNKTPHTDENDQEIKCPKCDSKELYTGFKSMKGIKGIFSAFVSFLLAVFPIYYKTVYKCKNCGEEFREAQRTKS